MACKVRNFHIAVAKAYERHLQVNVKSSVLVMGFFNMIWLVVMLLDLGFLGFIKSKTMLFAKILASFKQ
jgi:hypothetical protein